MTMEQLSFGVRPRGYRLPGATRVGAVRLQVVSLDRSVACYEDLLGFRVLERTPARVLLGVEGASTALLELHARPGVTPAPARATMGLYHFAILLPSRDHLGRFLRHLASRGARAGMADHLVSEAIYLTDPDGLGIEVYADRPRDTWQVANGELAMTTEPLDADDVVQAARGAWRGMPAGTVIGHVHLHVGGLDDAARFYHDGLGFDKVVWSHPGALFLSAGGYHHHLGTNTWAHGPNPSPDQARLLSWDIVVPRAEDAKAAAESLAAHGYEVQQDAGAWRAADPWGTTLRVVPEDR